MGIATSSQARVQPLRFVGGGVPARTRPARGAAVLETGSCACMPVIPGVSLPLPPGPLSPRIDPFAGCLTARVLVPYGLGAEAASGCWGEAFRLALVPSEAAASSSLSPERDGHATYPGSGASEKLLITLPGGVWDPVRCSSRSVAISHWLTFPVLVWWPLTKQLVEARLPPSSQPSPLCYCFVPKGRG